MASGFSYARPKPFQYQQFDYKSVQFTNIPNIDRRKPKKDEEESKEDENAKDEQHDESPDSTETTDIAASAIVQSANENQVASANDDPANDDDSPASNLDKQDPGKDSTDQSEAVKESSVIEQDPEPDVSTAKEPTDDGSKSDTVVADEATAAESSSSQDVGEETASSGPTSDEVTTSGGDVVNETEAGEPPSTETSTDNPPSDVTPPKDSADLASTEVENAAEESNKSEDDKQTVSEEEPAEVAETQQDPGVTPDSTPPAAPDPPSAPDPPTDTTPPAAPDPPTVNDVPESNTRDTESTNATKDPGDASTNVDAPVTAEPDSAATLETPIHDDRNANKKSKSKNKKVTLAPLPPPIHKSSTSKQTTKSSKTSSQKASKSKSKAKSSKSKSDQTVQKSKHEKKKSSSNSDEGQLSNVSDSSVVIDPTLESSPQIETDAKTENASDAKANPDHQTVDEKEVLDEAKNDQQEPDQSTTNADSQDCDRATEPNDTGNDQPKQEQPNLEQNNSQEDSAEVATTSPSTEDQEASAAVCSDICEQDGGVSLPSQSAEDNAPESLEASVEASKASAEPTAEEHGGETNNTAILPNSDVPSDEVVAASEPNEDVVTSNTDADLHSPPSPPTMETAADGQDQQDVIQGRSETEGGDQSNEPTHSVQPPSDGEAFTETIVEGAKEGGVDNETEVVSAETDLHTAEPKETSNNDGNENETKSASAEADLGGSALEEAGGNKDGAEMTSTEAEQNILATEEVPDDSNVIEGVVLTEPESSVPEAQTIPDDDNATEKPSTEPGPSTPAAQAVPDDNNGIETTSTEAEPSTPVVQREVEDDSKTEVVPTEVKTNTPEPQEVSENGGGTEVVSAEAESSGSELKDGDVDAAPPTNESVSENAEQPGIEQKSVDADPPPEIKPDEVSEVHDQREVESKDSSDNTERSTDNSNDNKIEEDAKNIDPNDVETTLDNEHPTIEPADVKEQADQRSAVNQEVSELDMAKDDKAEEPVHVESMNESKDTTASHSLDVQDPGSENTSTSTAESTAPPIESVHDEVEPPSAKEVSDSLQQGQLTSDQEPVLNNGSEPNNNAGEEQAIAVEEEPVAEVSPVDTSGSSLLDDSKQQQADTAEPETGANCEAAENDGFTNPNNEAVTKVEKEEDLQPTSNDSTTAVCISEVTEDTNQGKESAIDSTVMEVASAEALQPQKPTTQETPIPVQPSSVDSPAQETYPDGNEDHGTPDTLVEGQHEVKAAEPGDTTLDATMDSAVPPSMPQDISSTENSSSNPADTELPDAINLNKDEADNSVKTSEVSRDIVQSEMLDDKLNDTGADGSMTPVLTSSNPTDPDPELNNNDNDPTPRGDTVGVDGLDIRHYSTTEVSDPTPIMVDKEIVITDIVTPPPIDETAGNAEGELSAMPTPLIMEQGPSSPSTSTSAGKRRHKRQSAGRKREHGRPKSPSVEESSTTAARRKGRRTSESKTSLDRPQLKRPSTTQSLGDEAGVRSQHRVSRRSSGLDEPRKAHRSTRKGQHQSSTGSASTRPKLFDGRKAQSDAVFALWRSTKSNMDPVDSRVRKPKPTSVEDEEHVSSSSKEHRESKGLVTEAPIRKSKGLSTSEKDSRDIRRSERRKERRQDGLNSEEAEIGRHRREERRRSERIHTTSSTSRAFEDEPTSIESPKDDDGSANKVRRHHRKRHQPAVAPKLSFRDRAVESFKRIFTA